MARHVIHGIVGCLATSVAKVLERNITQSSTDIIINI